ncbi:Mrp/NBP35 family ATP-binding protein [Tistrella sp.]|uniref:Mrp/NBP35 family ATP-binding protein n=1 Tax=Tistrella sp. TaxID=2024861 RepID=UPI0025E5B971|nr:Mrp/NBP35 family ATP-binding protein [Tistrella sp.]
MSRTVRDQILSRLAGIRDPERGRDVVASGRISGLTVDEAGIARIMVETTPDRAAATEPLRREIEQAAAGVAGVTRVAAVLTAERTPGRGPGQAPRGGAGHGHGHGHSHAPAGPASGSATGPAAGQRPSAPVVPGVTAIIAVASGKGGVGKSTLAVNLALALQARGLKTGILDADVYGPSIPRMLGLQGRPDSPDGKRITPKIGWGLKAMSIGLMVEEDTPLIWRGPMVQGALDQFLRETDWAPLDVLVLDMPPGTGDVQLSIAQRVPLAGAGIVSTPQDIALLDARKGLAMFRKVEVPILGLVENMSWFTCPHCGGRSDIFGHGGARDEALKLGLPFLGAVPLDLDVRIMSDEGRPVVAVAPESEAAAPYHTIAAGVVESLGRVRREPPRIIIED